jgi:hypothetical protein
MVQTHLYTGRTQRSPPWWFETGESVTLQLYQPKHDPVIYIVPITSILGLLPLVPAGDHATITAAAVPQRGLAEVNTLS